MPLENTENFIIKYNLLMDRSHAREKLMDQLARLLPEGQSPFDSVFDIFNIILNGAKLGFLETNDVLDLVSYMEEFSEDAIKLSERYVNYLKILKKTALQQKGSAGREVYEKISRRPMEEEILKEEPIVNESVKPPVKTIRRRVTTPPVEPIPVDKGLNSISEENLFENEENGEDKFEEDIPQVKNEIDSEIQMAEFKKSSNSIFPVIPPNETSVNVAPINNPYNKKFHQVGDKASAKKGREVTLSPDAPKIDATPAGMAPKAQFEAISASKGGRLIFCPNKSCAWRGTAIQTLQENGMYLCPTCRTKLNR